MRAISVFFFPLSDLLFFVCVSVGCLLALQLLGCLFCVILHFQKRAKVIPTVVIADYLDFVRSSSLQFPLPFAYIIKRREENEQQKKKLRTEKKRNLICNLHMYNMFGAKFSIGVFVVRWLFGGPLTVEMLLFAKSFQMIHPTTWFSSLLALAFTLALALLHFILQLSFDFILPM